MKPWVEFIFETTVAALILSIIIFILAGLTGCQALDDGRQRRVLQCRLATLELEDAQREMRKAMIAGTVKYVQLDRVETAIGIVNRCVNEFTRE